MRRLLSKRPLPGLALLLAGLLAASACTRPAAPGEAAPDTTAAPAVAAAPLDTMLTPLGRDTADDRSVAQRLADAQTATRIRRALMRDERLRPFDFEAEVRRGQAVLAGSVATAAARDAASDVARRVEGVRSLTLHVGVRGDTAAQAAPPPIEAVPLEPAPPEAAPQQPAAKAQPEAATYHTVRSGDTLGAIARRYGVSVDQLRRLNELRGNTIRPGQRLRVK